ncbi:TIGR02757 family protein [Campylobacter fetus subsp. venerealis]|uniref:TIGR02757 family protein n=1 Tax=Campylobacter fetus TaxID=196 RepID=UPI0018E74F75|nr:TIGR02757 family protein [Campylobacter fetus]QQF52630.1 TIGR02757 family protein [Campylobacter fetus subsp. venerealis]
MNYRLKEILERALKEKNTLENLYLEADPLQVAAKFKNVHISLICALFAYGNAKAIVKFLNSLDFELLSLSDQIIEKEILAQKRLYRFQNPKDVSNIFITIKRAAQEDIQAIIKSGFDKNGLMIDGINSLINKIYDLNDYRSDGYEFFFGRSYQNEPKSPYKRYNMWLRWMVRDSDIDLGLFKNLPKSELIIPLDTHTHKVSLALGLCDRKSYDFKAAKEITLNLKNFDACDPIKYDFALYRIGQSKELDNVKSNLKNI